MNTIRKIIILIIAILFQISAFSQFPPQGSGCPFDISPYGTVTKSSDSGSFTVMVSELLNSTTGNSSTSSRAPDPSSGSTSLRSPGPGSGSYCEWVVEENASWITIFGSPGTVPGKFRVSYTSNTSSSSRSATIKLDGQTRITLVQNGVHASTPPSVPSPPTVTNNCGNSVLTRGNPPSGVTWYWQGKSSNGTSTHNSSSTYTIINEGGMAAIESGTYYLRARNNGGLWSTTSSSVYVNMYEIPLRPPTLTIVGNICGSSTLSRPGFPPSGEGWYWQTSTIGKDLSNANSTLEVLESGTYYLRAYDHTTACWSSAVNIQVSINTIPSEPTISSVVNNCGSSVLTMGTAPAGNAWYWQGESSNGTSENNSSDTYVTTTSGTFYLRAQNDISGCWGAATPVDVSIKANPTVTLSSDHTTINCTNLNSTLAVTGGVEYLWSTGATASTITVSPETETIYTVTVTGTNGCTSIANQTITVDKTAPTVTLIANQNTVSCQEPTAILTATGGNEYLWNTGGILSSISVSPTLSSLYVVTVTGTNTCTTTKSIEILVNRTPTIISSQPENISIGVGDLATFNIIAEGEKLSYQWQESTDGGISFVYITGANNSSYSVTASLDKDGNIYQCVVTGSCNTVTSTSVTLEVLTIEDALAHYSFNGNANDESGSNYHGTVNGATLTTDRFGNKNSAYSFDGVDDYISIGTARGVADGVNDFSISMWALIPGYNPATEQCLISRGNVQMFIRINGYAPNSLSARLYDQNDVWQTQGQSGVVTDGNWHNIIFNVNRDSVIEIYVDGSLLVKSEIVKASGSVSTTALRIGNRLGSNDYFNGKLDDIKVFNRAITPTEINELYTAPNPACAVEIINQPKSQAICLGSDTELKVDVQGVLNWKDPGIWRLYGNISWSEEMQVWMCIGKGSMYLSGFSPVEIDTTKSYNIKVEVFNTNHNSYFYWGGRRLTADRIKLKGYGATNDYSCTLGYKIPPQGVWATYSMEGKTGNKFSYYGWGDDGCKYYAVGGLINHTSKTDNDTTYIRNISFEEATQGIEYFGSSNIQYQWQKDEVNISGANNAKLELEEIQVTDEGNYTCEITTECDTVISEIVVINTLESPVITADIIGQKACANSNIQLNVSTTGQNLSYQWLKNGAAITGATTPAYEITGLDTSKTGYYVCEISNSNCTIEAEAMIDIEDLPNLFNKISNKMVQEGEQVEFKVEPKLNWQDPAIWKTSSGDVSWDSDKQAWKCTGRTNWYLQYNQAIAIDTNKSYNIKVEVYKEKGAGAFYWGGKRLTADKIRLNGFGGSFDYSCAPYKFPKAGEWITYTFEGKTGNSANLNGWGDDACAYYAIGGLINNAGADTEVTYIRNISFYNTTDGIEYFGNTDYTYQWQKDGVDIVGAIDPTYIVASAGSADEGDYKCVISNGCESIESLPSNLIVNSPVQQIKVKRGSSYSLSANEMPENNTFQWEYCSNYIQGGTNSWQNLSGEISEQLQLAEVNTADEGFYRALVTSINVAGLSKYSRITEIIATDAKATQPQYNGNISAVTWTDNKNNQSEYDYYYDQINRLTQAQYSSTQHGLDAYGIPEIKYDKNGNIESLTRMGLDAVSDIIEIDNLSYNYTGNQLTMVKDSGDINEGFIDYENELDYIYDANGNMISDKNKDIEIYYNHLNLPASVVFGNPTAGDSIVYVYDAMGTKHAKERYEGGILTKENVYAGELEFTDGLLQRVHTDEGIVNVTQNPTGETLVYEYFIKDHLGNTRAVVSETGDISQEMAYYPFGMQHKPVNNNSSNKYLYNGKELQDDLLNGTKLDWYDFHARFYMADLGRTTTQDPLAEINHDRSPYHFFSNNPINRIDPDGRDDYSINKKTGEFNLVRETDAETDKVLKTNRKGEVKTNRKGKEKVAIKEVEKGILSDGVNFKENDNLIKVGGEGQATENGVEAFALNLANYVGKEIGGAHFSQDGSGKTTHMTMGSYANNSLTETKGQGHSLYYRTMGKYDKTSLQSFFHTHPSNGISVSDRTSASQADKNARDNALKINPAMRFFILTNPINYGDGFPLKIDYTKH